MLTYFASGPRKFYDAPIPLLCRSRWEFLAVTSGQMSLVTKEGPDLLRTERLWVFAPDHIHGWTAEPGKAPKRSVFHFHTVPAILEQSIPADGHVEFPLSKPQLRRIQYLTQLVKDYWENPRPAMMFVHEYAKLELTLMTTQTVLREDVPLRGSAAERVHKAMQFFEQELDRSPNLDEIAKHTGISPVQLRRHFHEVMRASPKKIFDQIRFQKAFQLMSNSTHSLEEISSRCGFESPSAFSRAFKVKYGSSPTQWRL